MVKQREGKGHQPQVVPPLRQLSWSPLTELKDARRWRNEVCKHGGQPMGIFWTARKWPLDTERPLRIGFAEWRARLPGQFAFPLELWQVRNPALPLMLNRARRSMLFMYGSWWLLAMFLAIDVTRSLWVQIVLMGGATLMAAWAWYRTIKKVRWILRYDPRRSTGC